MYACVGGVPTTAQVDYVTLHLLEGEARTWYVGAALPPLTKSDRRC